MSTQPETTAAPGRSPAPSGSVLMPLLPCPFCGMDGLWCVNDEDMGEGWVQCSVCKARGPVGRPHPLAIPYWNRRRSPNDEDHPQPGAEVVERRKDKQNE